MKKITLALLILSLVFIIACQNVTNTPRACTEDAKLCPDGTAVGRTGPNCEFAPCPNTATTPEQVKVYCTEEQKQARACTREYMPVCGDDGVTYGNKCQACVEEGVGYYTQGECANKAI